MVNVGLLKNFIIYLQLGLGKNVCLVISKKSLKNIFKGASSCFLNFFVYYVEM